MAVVAVLAAFALHDLFALAWLGERVRIMMFLAAVMLGSWAGGLQAGVLAVVLSVILMASRFGDAASPESLRMWIDHVGLWLFVVLGLFISLLNEAMRRARWRAEASTAVAQRHVAEAEQASRALRESEQRLSLATWATNEGIWDYDLHTGVFWWNEAYDALVGGRPGETRYSWDWWIDRLHPDDQERVVSSLQAAIDGDGHRWSEEYRFRRGGDSYAYVLDRGYILRDDEAAATRVLGAMLDLTERKRSESELAHLRDELAVELSAMKRLHELGTRLLSTTEFVPMLDEILDAAVALAGADRGCIELCAADGTQLHIASCRDSAGEAVSAWKNPVSAADRGTRWIVADVETDSSCASWRQSVLAEGYRAFQITPLIGRRGEPLGALATFFRQPHRLTERDLRVADLVARQASELIDWQRAARALRDSEEQYRAAFELGATGQIQIDARTRRFTKVNRKFSTITGYAESELLAMTLSDLLHPDDRRLAEERFDRLAQGQSSEWADAARFTRKDGTIGWVELSAAVLRDRLGAPMRILAIMHDITDRVRAEELLAAEHLHTERERRRLRALLDVLPVAIFIADSHGRIEEINQQAARLWGNAPEHYQPSRYKEDYKAWWPDSGRRVEPHEWGMARALATGEISLGEEMEIETFEGQHKTILSYALPIRDASGAIVGGVAVNVDISERKRAEMAIKEADRRKDEFLATLAHELRNPLAPISHGVELLEMVREEPARIDELCQTMRRQVRQLVRLIDDLLDVSRITRGKLQLRKERVALDEVIQTALESVRPLVDQARHELLVEATNERLWLEGDPTRLAQVLVNLLNNAAKYTPPEGRIWFSVGREGSEAVVRVRDSGVGMPPDQLPHVFEMFTQLDRTLDSTQSGLGIGLTLVKILVEMHGGAISAHSQGPGLGSEFVVRLPLAGSPIAVKLPRSEPVPSACRYRVLVVEDTAPVARVFAMMLERLGHEVTIATDGFQAIECVQQSVPDIIISDISMPRMSGYELAQRLRQMPELAETVLIAMTGYGQAEDRQRALDAGFEHHLVKPVEMAVLNRLLADIANQTASRRP